MMKPTFGKRILFFVLSDLFLSAATLYLAYALRFNFAIPSHFLDNFWRIYSVLVLFKIAAFFFFRIYFSSWRFFGLQDFKRLFYGHVAAYTAFVALFLAAREWFIPMPRSAIAIDFVLSMMVLGGLRISKRLVIESAGDREKKKCLIVGVTPRTSQIIKSALSGEIPYYPAAVIDTQGTMSGTYVENVKVYGMDRLAEVIEKEEAKAALIAQRFEPKELDELVEKLDALGVRELKMVSLLADRNEQLKDIAIEDLLARQPKDLDTKAIEKFVKGKTILVTGAGGSIGSEICRQVLKFGAARLVMVDNSEYNLYQIAEQMDPSRSVAKLVSVLDRKRLAQLFAKYRPQIVLHAAAYKHVPLCEENVEMAVENNILGVKNVIDLSIRYEVEKVVNISSDKAVRPTNVMGATKRVGELYAQNVPSEKTEIVSVRFGNVLGSSGSVVPKFREQIQKGGPVTVTHPEITRYFMLIPEACQLVLQAAAMAKGGELFILDMGEPVKIVDLAKKMIRLYGKEDEIDIEFTGLRPGEKLYEELLIDEAECKTRYESIYVAKSTHYDIDELNRDIDELLESDNKPEVLKRIVPEFMRREVDRLKKPGAEPDGREKSA
ncbi:polysaccharide biosynthesis protein [Hydrogenimonas urashimensis]|uniref:polysaccharide biosynthesis protein n=1 Tax=Hydrogenimonas urashimensis TaxID=2740515 RepID=UPI001916542E|nr:nucleoside-diphosphate sugar epimerase/dehydratase [Hydrogenimonas urashimensis]